MLIESKIRRELSRFGYRLNKTPARHWSRKHYDVGFMVLDGNRVVLGASQREYSATLEDVQTLIDDLNARKAA
ncbi:hypothetical protein [Sinorhizobium meliloti]|uniref:hypothetical protein n=1 Tax=Rhizobium meliloti TaxID=382 RepID=UPI000FDAAD16|nr:hypothetical protein [Sinorhizobium meliloti]RVM19915.1 hypothetical protein CN134_02570 [Sinorhizobium meliloti]RVO31822.1 hypothetical protein CN098_11915 [Sinorhizobium meliloti]